MEIDADQLLGNALRDGIRDAVKAKFTSSYQNPMDKLMDAAIAKHSESLRQILDSALKTTIGDPAFREDIALSLRSVLAKTLVQKFGGELEKQVNVLKSDPTTRARITVAIEEIVKSKTV